MCATGLRAVRPVRMFCRRAALEKVQQTGNQIAVASEGNYTALVDHGISSIDGMTRLTQNQFNR